MTTPVAGVPALARPNVTFGNSKQPAGAGSPQASVDATATKETDGSIAGFLEGGVNAKANVDMTLQQRKRTEVIRDKKRQSLETSRRKLTVKADAEGGYKLEGDLSLSGKAKQVLQMLGSLFTSGADAEAPSTESAGDTVTIQQERSQDNTANAEAGGKLKANVKAQGAVNFDVTDDKQDSTVKGKTETRTRRTTSAKGRVAVDQYQGDTKAILDGKVVKLAQNALTTLQQLNILG